MRKITLLILLIYFNTSAYSQVIKGTIKDNVTKNNISFAVVYFNGTFMGTHADQNGYFELNISNNLSMPLTISALGYYSLTIPDLSANKYYRIYLTPKVFELNEVVISAKASAKARKERKTNLDLFKKVFLGNTMNAMKCDIINEYEIMLFHKIHSDTLKTSRGIFIRNSDTLKAFSSSPIIINNNALGYKITYYLDKFEYRDLDKYFLIVGNSFFEQYSTKTNREQHRYEERRKSAYLGSRMQFFRALWENNLDSSGFTVKNSSNDKLAYDNFVIQTDSLLGPDHLKCFNHRGILYITYYSKSPTSHITIDRDRVYFNKNRVLDPTSVTWFGEMARQRIGDLLPFEYEIK